MLTKTFTNKTGSTMKKIMDKIIEGNSICIGTISLFYALMRFKHAVSLSILETIISILINSIILTTLYVGLSELNDR